MKYVGTVLGQGLGVGGGGVGDTTAFLSVVLH